MLGKQTRGSMPVRRVVRRGHRSNVGFFPSLKMGRFIAYESPLERDFLVRVEVDPDVTAICEQPQTLFWYDGTVCRRHIPDFLIIRQGQKELREVKWLCEVDQHATRTATIIRDQKRIGVSYKVVSEDTIKHEPGFTNANLLLNGRRCAPNPSIHLLIMNLFQTEWHAISLREILTHLDSSDISVNNLYSLILSGELELSQPDRILDRDSFVRQRRR